MKLLPDLEYVSVAETKSRLSEKLRRIESHNRRFAITSHGKPKAVLLSYKDYLALVEPSDNEIKKTISLKEWNKEKKEREKVVNSVASLFDETKLTRKGQKRYKRDEVRKLKK